MLKTNVSNQNAADANPARPHCQQSLRFDRLVSCLQRLVSSHQRPTAALFGGFLVRLRLTLKTRFMRLYKHEISFCAQKKKKRTFQTKPLAIDTLFPSLGLRPAQSDASTHGTSTGFVRRCYELDSTACNLLPNGSPL